MRPVCFQVGFNMNKSKNAVDEANVHRIRLTSAWKVESVGESQNKWLLCVARKFHGVPNLTFLPTIWLHIQPIADDDAVYLNNSPLLMTKVKSLARADITGSIMPTNELQIFYSKASAPDLKLPVDFNVWLEISDQPATK